MKIEESPDHSVSQSPTAPESNEQETTGEVAEQPGNFATRAAINATSGVGKNKLILLGGGLAVAVLFFVFTAIVGKSPKK